MDPSFFRKVIDECAELGIESIFLNFYGEPVLHEDFLEFVKYAKDRTKARVSFDTNAVAFSREVSEALMKAGSDVTVSLHGLDRETYKRIHGVDAFSRVIRNVNELVTIRNELKGDNRIYVQTTKMDITYHTDEEVSTRLKELFGDGVIHSITDCTAIGGFCREDHRMEKTPLVRTSPCRYLLDHLAVLWNGDVTVCCSDFDGLLKIGNAKDSTLAEIWGNEQHRKYQRTHLMRRFNSMPLCATCDG
jgi:radical SAM protein with 4Fe4S-binding SPASM domain